MDLPVPTPVSIELYDRDVDAMQADYLRHCHGVPRPWAFWVGIAYLVFAVAKVARHQDDWWFWALLAAISLIMSTRAGAEFPSTERPTELRFSADGLDVDVAFARDQPWHFSWRRIRAIHDIGESFVLVPAFGKRLVFPKRSFPDGGREAWAFFAAHGVAGRTPAVQPVAVS